MDYLVVVEKGPSSFGAYVPDLAGLGVVGRSLSEVKRLVKEAIELHVSGLREDGLPVPQPAARSLKVAAPTWRPRPTVSPTRSTSKRQNALSGSPLHKKGLEVNHRRLRRSQKSTPSSGHPRNTSR
ncbi:MAG: type II toxin-antitoxin system HicB family antitoxin [Gammaproteobacteria bacterium]